MTEISTEPDHSPQRKQEIKFLTFRSDDLITILSKNHPPTKKVITFTGKTRTCQTAINKKKKKDRDSKTKMVLTKALDDIVKMNTIFTMFNMAVFLGLSDASPSHLQGLENRRDCNASLEVGKDLILYQVVSFACCLLSILVAKFLKLYINMVFSHPRLKNLKGFVRVLECIMFTLSLMPSIVVVLFLTLSIVDVIQVRIGLLSCGSHHARSAVAALALIVPFAAMSRKLVEPSKRHATALRSWSAKFPVQLRSFWFPAAEDIRV